MSRETISLDEFRARLKAQGVGDRTHLAFKCPVCATVQSLQSFFCAGTDAETAEKFIGFSCVGRVTGAPSPRKEPDGQPCNWTLGGFLQLHALEVIDEDGNAHPHFVVASADEAQALSIANAALASACADDACPGEHQEVLDAIQSHNSGEDE